MFTHDFTAWNEDSLGLIKHFYTLLQVPFTQMKCSFSQRPSAAEAAPSSIICSDIHTGVLANVWKGWSQPARHGTMDGFSYFKAACLLLWFCRDIYCTGETMPGKQHWSCERSASFLAQHTMIFTFYSISKLRAITGWTHSALSSSPCNVQLIARAGPLTNSTAP